MLVVRSMRSLIQSNVRGKELDQDNREIEDFHKNYNRHEVIGHVLDAIVRGAESLPSLVSQC